MKEMIIVVKLTSEGPEDEDTIKKSTSNGRDEEMSRFIIWCGQLLSILAQPEYEDDLYD